MATEKLMQFTIKQGMNQDILKTYPDNHFDSIVTDPPYGIEFLGKEWDKNTGAVETWEECFRVLKPGGHILAFSAARTYHNLATNIESVGFEIRDQLMWLYASGFPKAQDIGKAIDKRAKKGQDQTVRAEYNGGKHGSKNVDLSMQGTRCPVCKKDSTARYSCDKGQECGMIYKAQTPEAEQWSGWKTALKPAHEPIVMARKPFKGSCIDNVLKHGTGALNIDASRVPYDDPQEAEADAKWREKWSKKNVGGPTFQGSDIYEQRAAKSSRLKVQKQGKRPPNLNNIGTASDIETSDVPWIPSNDGRYPSNVLGEIPDYQKYFYCPKVSRAERHVGFESVPDRVCGPGGDDWVTAQEHQGNNKKGSLDHIPTIGYNNGDAMGQLAGSNSKQLKNLVDGKANAKGYTQDGTLGRMKDAMHNSPSVGNNHPTVKPVALMSYLVKLVTPPGGKVLDPFNGSGSTGMAAVEHGFEYTGCELDPAYVEIATKRIEGWYAKTLPDNNYNELFD